MYLWHQVIPSKLIQTCKWSNAFKNRINSANWQKKNQSENLANQWTALVCKVMSDSYNLITKNVFKEKKDESEFQSTRKFYNESVSICQIRYGYVRE